MTVAGTDTAALAPECVRESTSAGPDFCATCSSALGDWVQWEGHSARERSLVRSLAAALSRANRYEEALREIDARCTSGADPVQLRHAASRVARAALTGDTP